MKNNIKFKSEKWWTTITEGENTRIYTDSDNIDNHISYLKLLGQCYMLMLN